MQHPPERIALSKPSLLRVTALIAAAALASCETPSALAEGNSIGGTIGGGGSPGGSGGSIGGKIAPAPSAPAEAAPARKASPAQAPRRAAAERRRPTRRAEPEIRRAARSQRDRQAESGRGGGGGGGGGGSVSRFDGLWTWNTYSSQCENTSTTQQRISHGRIISLASGGTSTGSVSPNGSVRTVGHYIGQTFISSGRMTENSASGSFHRSDGCRGTWSASR